MDKKPNKNLTRRGVIKTLGAGAGIATASSFLPGLSQFAHAQSSGPIKIGFQMHSPGIGASSGRWYDRTTKAAVQHQ